jgi:hypothetical protein
MTIQQMTELTQCFRRSLQRVLFSLVCVVLLLVIGGQNCQAFKGLVSPTPPTQPAQNEPIPSAIDQNDTVPENNLPTTASTPKQNSQDSGQVTLDSLANEFLLANPQVRYLRDSDVRDKDGRPIPGYVNPALVKGASPNGTMYPPTPAATMGWRTESKLYEGMYMSGLNGLSGFNGHVNSDLKSYAQELQAGDFMARTMQYPLNVANQAKAQTIAQADAIGNAMGDMAKGQSASAISYCSSFMTNFTAEEGNRWNKIRNGLFIPIAILLLLPGAVLTQVKAMVSAGNPALGDMNPFDGILRSMVAIFLIPATFLVVNYGIDFSNSIVSSIASTYENVMGRNMYQDALGAEFRAFPVRSPKENQNSGAPQKWPNKKITSVQDYEDMFLTNKIVDPTTGLYVVPKNKTDEAMPAGAVAARELSFGTNAALTAAWNILCAFQMAYLAYLFFVGPIVAALWVWPMKQFRDALPNWIEGVCTVCFWSLFWNTAILLMACFKGVDESGTVITTALNFLATSSVKYAFDFAGLVKAAGQQAAQKAMEKGGAKNGAGKAGAHGAKGHAGTGGANTQSQKTTNPDPNTKSTDPNTQSNVTTSSNRSESLTLTSQLSSFRKSDNSSTAPLDYQMPPMSLKVDPNLSSRSAQLGNYVVTRGFKQDGSQVDYLKTANGQVIAELPPGLAASGESFTPNGVANGVSMTATKDGSGVTSYTMTDISNSKHIAQLSSLIDADNATQNAAKVESDAQNRSIALKSQEGTILLENNGQSVLVPRADGHGYDSFALEKGATQGTFALANGRSLFVTNGQGGQHQVMINDPKGPIESFAVTSTGNSGFDIQHTITGGASASTQVTTDGTKTVYTNKDSSGNITDRDTINGNTITSEIFDPAKSTTAPIGTATRDYDSKGGYTAVYRDATNHTLATATHVLKDGDGFIDTVLDRSGAKVSELNASPDTNGGFSIETSRYRDGVVEGSEVKTYDANMTLVDTPPVVLPKESNNQSLSVAPVDLLKSSVNSAFFTSSSEGVNNQLNSQSNVQVNTQSNIQPSTQSNTQSNFQSNTQSNTVFARQSNDNSFYGASTAATPDTSSIANNASTEFAPRYSSVSAPKDVAPSDNNVFEFMNRISNVTAVNESNTSLNGQSGSRDADSPNVFSMNEFEAESFSREAISENAEFRSSDSLQQQITSAPSLNMQRPRAIAQILKTTLPAARTKHDLASSHA